MTVLRVNSKLFLALLGFLLISQDFADTTNNAWGPIREPEFSRYTLTQNPQSSFQLLNPDNFTMSQSYSMTFSGSSAGSRSAGVYLNTLSYRFGIPLTLSVEIGAYNLFSSTLPQNYLAEQTNQPEFIIPSISLEYQPTKNLLIGLQILNGNDAYKAYGPFYSHFSPLNRSH